MKKYQRYETDTRSAKDTEAFGKAIGERLHGGEVIELVSDLGGGKTTLVKGLAQGIGSTDKVSSPTFTISQEYHAGNRTLFHFDFYRLPEAGIVANELAEVLGDPHAAVVVEWGDIVQDVLPEDRITIRIQATGEDERHIALTYPGSREYAIPRGTK